MTKVSTVQIGPEVSAAGGELRCIDETRWAETAATYRTSWACREMPELGSSVWRAGEGRESLSVLDTTASPFGPVGVGQAGLVFEGGRLVRVKFF